MNGLYVRSLLQNIRFLIRRTTTRNYENNCSKKQKYRGPTLLSLNFLLWPWSQSDWSAQSATSDPGYRDLSVTGERWPFKRIQTERIALQGMPIAAELLRQEFCTAGLMIRLTKWCSRAGEEARAVYFLLKQVSKQRCRQSDIKSFSLLPRGECSFENRGAN